MKPRHCLVLVLTSALAIGCAAARAQEGGQDGGTGNPPPGQPPAPAPETRERRRPPQEEDALRRSIEQQIRDAEDQVVEAEARVAKLKTDGLGEKSEQLVAAQRDLEVLRVRVKRFRERIEQIAAEGPRPGRGDRGGGRGGPDDEMKREMERMRGLPYAGGPRVLGPNPHDARLRAEHLRELASGSLVSLSVEKRLEMLERAVREMREMFERHNVPPEARERAEREMRDRRDGPPTGRHEGPRDGQGPRGFGGPDTRPGADRPPESSDRPPVPRPAMPRFEMNQAEVEKLRAAMEEQMRAAHEQMAAMKKQLADAQEALKKAMAEIDELKSKK